MDEKKAKEILDKVVGQVFGYQNPLTLEQGLQKYAFDVRLPQQVFDSTDNSPTWAQSTNPVKFIKMQNAWDRQDIDDWLIPKRKLETLQDILAAWGEVNFTATERVVDSQGVMRSDNVYSSENVYMSQDINVCKNVLFCDSVQTSEFIVAGQRSQTSSFCIRLEDSQECSNSFSLSWCKKTTNSFFLHDCNNVQDSMFCSHMSGKRFCIANMQFTEEEYNKLKPLVIQWALSPES